MWLVTIGRTIIRKKLGNCLLKDPTIIPEAEAIMFHSTNDSVSQKILTLEQCDQIGQLFKAFGNI